MVEANFERRRIILLIFPSPRHANKGIDAEELFEFFVEGVMFQASKCCVDSAVFF